MKFYSIWNKLFSFGLKSSNKMNIRNIIYISCKKIDISKIFFLEEKKKLQYIYLIKSVQDCKNKILHHLMMGKFPILIWQKF